MNDKLNEFLEFHDEQVCKWLHIMEGKNEPCELKEIFQNDTKGNLDFENLPSPYFGDPYDCSAVIININPGASSVDSEYKNSRAREIDLLKKFDNKYRDFAKEFHFLNFCYQGENAIDEAGNKWWRSRVAWMKRIGGIPLEKQDKNPFSLELCPWHSHKWSGLKNDHELEKYIKNRVLIPAVEAVKKNKLKCAYAIGKPIYECFRQCECKEKIHYDASNWNGIGNFLEWPVNNENQLNKREFSVLAYNGVKILCTWTQGGNETPSKVFDNIIKEIISNKV